MIAVDTNLLVYAHRGDSAFHTRAKASVKTLAEGRAAWAIPWPCVHEFFAVVTHPRIYDPPTTADLALDQLDAWLESPGLLLLGEEPGYYAHLQQLVKESQIVGPRIHDARVAALCIFHGIAELWSADRDFTRFASLQVRNPIARP